VRAAPSRSEVAREAAADGGSGFLGKNVARALHARGHELRLLAREGSDLSGLPAGLELARGDVTDADSLRHAALGCAAVLHMAALVKTWVPDSERFEAVNLGGFRNALAAARSAGARLVYTSSFIAVGPTGLEPVDEGRLHPGEPYRNDYERTKALADAEARQAAQAGADLVMLYPGVIYGAGRPDRRQPGGQAGGRSPARARARHPGPGRPAVVLLLRGGRRGRHVAALERAARASATSCAARTWT